MNLDSHITLDLLATRFFMPRLRSWSVARQRLIARLNDVLERRLALVCAPAGYGKTTLLSAWAGGLTDVVVAWLSLDKEDNDPLTFWRYLQTALRIGEPLVPASQAAQDRSIRVMLTHLLNEVSSRSEHIVLLLDDYHLIQNPAIHAEMAFLLDHLPPNMHLVLATRSQPPLSLARLRLRQQLVELGVEDLRFTLDEVLEFVQQELGATLGEQDIVALEEQSEGWIAGLQLAVLSLRERSNVSAFIKTISGGQRYIFDYLAEEVLVGLSTDEQQFLLHTSILQRLCAGICSALTGIEDSQAILTRLLKANLFLVPLDDRGCWYRYHHLFADALYQRLQHLYPARIADLHVRASNWYKEHELIPEAFEHALAAADFQRATRLLLAFRQRLLLSGEMRMLRAWIERLPRAFVRASPELILAYFWTVADAERLAEAQQCLDDLKQVLSEAGTQVAASFTVALNSASSTYERISKNFSQAIALIQQALQDTPQSDYSQLSYMQLHLAEYHWVTGDIAQARRAIQQSLEASEAGNYPYFIATDWLYLSHMLASVGRLERALAGYQRALRLADESDGRRYSLSGDAHLGLARLYYELDDLISARQHLDECERLSRRVGDSHTLFYAALLLVRLELASDNLVGARQVVCDLEPRPADFDFFFHCDGFIELCTRVLLALSETEAAASLLDQFSDVRLSSLLQEDLELARARLLLASPGQIAGFEGLRPLLHLAQNQGRKTSAIRILLVQALILVAQGSFTRALSPLSQALVLAEPAGFVRIFVDEGAALRPLLLALHDTATTVSQEYILRLLAKLPLEIPADTLTQHTPADEAFVLRDPLSERELEILRLIAAGRSNQEITAHLVIALSTLKTHINRMYGKLGVSSRTQALVRARRLRLL